MNPTTAQQSSIDLKNGDKILVDPEFSHLNQWKWNLNSRGYARRTIVDKKNKGGYKTVLMHRLIMGSPVKDVDHINGNKLDNRKENLRLCTETENGFNRGKQTNNTSGFKGVYWDKNKWAARVGEGQRKYKYIGRFLSPELAAKAYDIWALALHGKFAYTNFV